MSARATAGSGEETGGGSNRLRLARERVADARATARSARSAAAPAYAARDRRRRGRLALAGGCAAAVAVVLLIAAIVLAVQHRAAEQDRARDSAVLDDTRSAIATLLTIDPAEPQRFLDEALAVTSGEQHQRLVDARPQVLELVGQLEAPSTGQVLAAGITGDVDDDTARVYVVAEGTNPALLGAGAGQNRVALVVTMKADDGRWKIDRTQLQ